MTVIIVNYRSAELVADCVASLQGVKRILVWDNNSGSFDRAVLCELGDRDERVQLLASESNIGFGAAVNRAISSAALGSDEFVWILNPDTRASEDTVDWLLRAVLKDGYDVVSPLIVTGNPDAPKIWYQGGEMDVRRGRVRHLGQGDPVSSVGGTEIQRVSFVTGAAPFMRMSTWVEVGGFREDLFLYWEDADWSRRASGLGHALGLVPNAKIWHLVGGSSGSADSRSELYYYYMQRNRFLVFSCTSGRLRFVFRGSREMVRLFLHAARQPEGRWRKLLAGWRGILDGLKGRTGRWASGVPRPSKP